MDQRFHPTRDRRVWQGPGQISRSRLADRSDPPRMHSRALVFLHPFAVHLAAPRRQRLHKRSFHRSGRLFARADACLSAAGESETEGRSKYRTIFHPLWLRSSHFVLARPHFLFSETKQSAPAHPPMHSPIAEIAPLASRPHRGLPPHPPPPTPRPPPP